METRMYPMRLDDIDAAQLGALARAHGRTPEEQLAVMVHEALAEAADRAVHGDDAVPERDSAP